MFERFWTWLRGLIGTRDNRQPADHAATTAAVSALPNEIAACIRSADGDPDSGRLWFSAETGPVFVFSIHGSKAESVWRMLADAFSKTGYWPIIVGDDESIALHEEARGANADSYPNGLSAILARADKLDLFAWAERRRELDAKHDEEYARPIGEVWPTPEPPRPLFYLTQTLTRKKPKPKVHVALYPVADCSEVLGLVRYGDWNACPPPEIHVAMCRHLAKRYGARLAAIGPDTIEYDVPNLPGTLDAAFDEAQLQFDYCGDIVTQGVATIRALAVALQADRKWFFWWD